MRLLYGHSEAVAAFCASRIPECVRGFGPCTAIGVLDDDGGLVGGVVLHNWNPEAGTIEMSMAAVDRRWLVRPLIRELGDYVFRQLRCQALITRYAPEASAISRMMRAIGVVEYRIPRLRGRERDEVLSVLTDDAWRASKFSKETTHGWKSEASEAA